MQAQSLSQNGSHYRRLENSRSRNVSSGNRSYQDRTGQGSSPEEYSRNLEARRSGNDLGAKRINSQLKGMRQSMNKLKEAAPSPKLLLYLEPRVDWAFGVALLTALLKDALDWVGLGSLPLIGTVITFMASTVIFGALMLTGSRSKKKQTKMVIKKFGTLFGGSFVEAVFGLNFLPIESFIVIITFYLTLVERRTNRE